MDRSSMKGKSIKTSLKKQGIESKRSAGIQAKEVSRANKLRSKHTYKIALEASRLNESEVTYTSKIRSIGNSSGVILNSQLIKTAGLVPDQDILIQASAGIITIVQVKDTAVNLDRSTWDKQFKSAIKKAGSEPDSDLFDGMENEFDKKDWKYESV
jgi:antitoxin component of MazEF toxin-antitoxin module